MICAGGIAALVLLPIVSVFWIAAHPDAPLWGHLMATTLPRYLSNTLIVMSAVGILSAIIGTGTAWLVVSYQFPGRNWLRQILLKPL